MIWREIRGWLMVAPGEIFADKQPAPVTPMNPAMQAIALNPSVTYLASCDIAHVKRLRAFHSYGDTLAASFGFIP
ncbi:MAG: hypothetical protein ACXWJW_07640 [Xanthobacteraceae bacterium]